MTVTITNTDNNMFCTHFTQKKITSRPPLVIRSQIKRLALSTASIYRTKYDWRYVAQNFSEVKKEKKEARRCRWIYRTQAKTNLEIHSTDCTFSESQNPMKNVTKQKWFCCSPAQWGLYAVALSSHLLCNCTIALVFWKEVGKYLTTHPNRTPIACIKSNNMVW